MSHFMNSQPQQQPQPPSATSRAGRCGRAWSGRWAAVVAQHRWGRYGSGCWRGKAVRRQWDSNRLGTNSGVASHEFQQGWMWLSSYACMLVAFLGLFCLLLLLGWWHEKFAPRSCKGGSKVDGSQPPNRRPSAPQAHQIPHQPAWWLQPQLSGSKLSGPKQPTHGPPTQP